MTAAEILRRERARERAAVELRPDVGALPFRRRLALALAVLFKRETLLPYVELEASQARMPSALPAPRRGKQNRAQRRAAARL